MKTIKVAFDLGGVISKWPDVFRPIIDALSQNDAVEVHFISDMHPVEKVIDALERNSIWFDQRRVHSADYKTHGELCKAVVCEQLGIDLLIDDFPGYVATIGFPTVRLLVMPDPSLPYYATAVEPEDPHWFTDGSEGDFGRRNPAGSKRPPETRPPKGSVP